MKKLVAFFALMATTLIIASRLLTSGPATKKATGDVNARTSISTQNKLPDDQVFQRLLDAHRDLPAADFLAEIAARRYVTDLSFDPTSSKHFDRVATVLQLNEQERDIFRRNGFVSVDHDQAYSFGAMYYAVDARELPVLVTTDSILHALHCSYDAIMQELETKLLSPTIDKILARCHDELPRRSRTNSRAVLKPSFRDVDLYLTVARNLLAGAGAPAKDSGVPPSDPLSTLLRTAQQESETWDGTLIIPSKLGQDAKALEILRLIQSLVLQVPRQTSPTEIYGGRRYVDYSQFRARGHYTKSTQLARYFRCMMWLGRGDCGWNLLPPNPISQLEVDADRELRDAVLVAELLTKTGSVKPLSGMDEIIEFLVGRSDDLTSFGLLRLMQDGNVDSVVDVSDDNSLGRVRMLVESSGDARQRIRSQVIVSDPNDTYKVPPPSICQLFGQRFAIDSFVLAQVVFDSIIYENRKRERMMPSGLDVMAALGNNEAIPLLADELTRHQYAANLRACREFVDLQDRDFWKQNLYNVWLDCLTVLDDDLGRQQHVPQTMRTHAWQMKQLQTQLASWAELRHDTILYAKQSYTATPLCEYPAGYVEPYPQFYAKVEYLADEAAERLAGLDYSFGTTDPKVAETMRMRQLDFFGKLAKIMQQLHRLTTKELEAQPFTAAEQQWLKKLIDARGQGSGPPRYNGWYCELFYGTGGQRAAKWDPTVADVHTNPRDRSVLHVAVGNTNFCVVAVDNDDDRMTFVGPVFSYYEFEQPARSRLTDPEWQQMIQKGVDLPQRPAWTGPFQGPRQKRRLGMPPDVQIPGNRRPSPDEAPAP